MYFCSVKCAKDKQVAAVAMRFLRLLLRANLPEICLRKVLQHDKTRFGGIFVSVVSD